ncbi:hypothetical protein EG328_007903 [Venturia inaequalis]|uniref:Uncharacterized protein n=1 Tax=Venturia inaequalis TaxID=5025 RepID=A0A8H3YSN3_VENIN|nr:hypothetical protein EG328_007903 [Venturia inaequalis]
MDPNFRKLLREQRRCSSPPQGQRKRPVQRKLPQPQSAKQIDPESSIAAAPSQKPTTTKRKINQLGGQVPQQHSSAQNLPVSKRRKIESISQDQPASKRQKTQQAGNHSKPPPVYPIIPEEQDEAPTIQQTETSPTTAKNTPLSKQRKTNQGGPNQEPPPTTSPPPTSQNQQQPPTPKTPHPTSPFTKNQTVYLNLRTPSRGYPFHPHRPNPVPEHMPLSTARTIIAVRAIHTRYGALWRYRLRGHKPWHWFSESDLVDEWGRDSLDLRGEAGRRGYRPEGPIVGEALWENPGMVALD